MTRLAILASHPVQYYAPLFKKLAGLVDVHVFYAHRASPQDQARAGFGKAFDWDVDLASGYSHEFLVNISMRPGTDHFSGCDTPGILARLLEGRYDALLVTGWHLKSYLQGVFAAKRAGIPVFVRGDSHLQTPRTAFKRYAKNLVYPVFLRRFDAALYVGERSRAYFAHYAFPSERLFFSPHCVDASWFRQRATQQARQTFRSDHAIAEGTALALFCGKLIERKRVSDLIDAVAICRRAGLLVEVCVAGDGPLQPELKRRAVEADVPAHWLGFCNQSMLPAIYAGCDFLVLPSSAHETWGLVANEALASGRPVIVSDQCGCHPDLTRSAGPGRHFHAGDVKGLAQAIGDLVDLPPNPKSISELSARYSLDAAANGVRTAVEWLAADRKAR